MLALQQLQLRPALRSTIVCRRRLSPGLKTRIEAVRPFYGARRLAETRQYLRDFDCLNEATANARELYEEMLELYPDRVNPGSLWGAANTAKKQA